MKNSNITEEKISNAFNLAAPDVLSSVLSDCENSRGKVIFMTKKKKSSAFYLKIGGAAAAACIAFASFGGAYVYSNFYAVASTIGLEVNPSVEIEVNKKEKVLNVIAANDDAKVIIGDMDFKGNSLEVTVNALIGSMLKNGYLNDNANSVLISVDTDDKNAGEALRIKLAANVDRLLKEDRFDGAVVSQSISADKALDELSKQYDISHGKAQMINSIVEAEPIYTFDDLSALSVNELSLLAEDRKNGTNALETAGKASEKAYIGAEAAINAALASAGASREDVRELECELDREKGVMVYEVEFEFGGHEYSYDIGAVDGSIVLTGKDREDGLGGKIPETPVTHAPDTNPRPSQNDTSVTFIGKDKALEIALSHAGVTRDVIYDLENKFERDDGRESYEIKFDAGGVDYEYDIDAKNGKIIKSEKDRDDDYYDDDRYNDWDD